MQAGGEEVLRFAGFTLDLRRGCVRAGDREMELRPKSFAVLKYLVENAGRLVAKDELINAIWPSVSVADESLTHCVSDVRRALSDSDRCLNTAKATPAPRAYRIIR
jgi:DNA-binding winged helix-turn-helix (wHTH) protein